MYIYWGSLCFFHISFLITVLKLLFGFLFIAVMLLSCIVMNVKSNNNMVNHHADMALYILTT